MSPAYLWKKLKELRAAVASMLVTLSDKLGKSRDTLGAMVKEHTHTVAAACNLTAHIEALTAGVWRWTTAASADWTWNLRGSATESLDSLMAVGDMLTLILRTTQGATAYKLTALTIDGASVTIKWLDKLAVASGTPDATDVYTVSILKTGAATWSVSVARSVFGVGA